MIDADLDGTPYQAYAYGYPHKTAYRAIAPARQLADVWRDESTAALFGYVHVPFCESRCGFCNLFTDAGANPPAERYLAALRRQAEQTRAALGAHAHFARLAVGGGTPTVLDARQLDTLFEITAALGADARRIPTSVEVSPATADDDRLAVLARWGVQRVSIGVQTFSAVQSRSIGRPHDLAAIEAALQAIRRHGFPTLNIDLIYGGAAQSPDAFLEDVSRALAWEPEELYLYPLYVRPLTGLGRLQRSAGDQRLLAYRAARDRLRALGWSQVSMRMFRAPWAPSTHGPEYCCQRDGMVGLGPGARSYTRSLHYATDFAVGKASIRTIIEAWLEREHFDRVEHGFELSIDERRRRFVLQSLLQASGLSRVEYGATFGSDALADLPQLADLVARGWATLDAYAIVLTDAGVEQSDAIAPWLYSQAVRAAMTAWEAR